MFKNITKFLDDVVNYSKDAILTYQVNKRISKSIEDYERNAKESITKTLPRVNNVDRRTLALLNLKAFDCKDLSERLVEEWDNIYLHQFLENLFDLLLSYGELSKEPVQTYRYYLHVEKVLGRGAQGIVSAGVIGSCDKPFFAIKNTRSYDPSDILREFVIGRELSSIRNSVFTHIYTIFPCSNVLSVMKNVIGYCQNDSQYSIGFQLLNGKNLKDAELTTSEFETIFIIILSALCDAAKIQFTHHDLHNENVFVQKLAAPIIVPIRIPGLDISYVKTEHFPFILDYGLARVQSKHGAIFPEGFEKYGIKDEYVPMHDVYKLLFFTLKDQPDLKIEHLMTIFDKNITPINSRDFIKDLSKRNQFFVVPEQLRKMTINEYVSSVRIHLEKYAYKGDINSYRMLGSYKEKDYFKEYDLLREVRAGDLFTDNVLITFNIPLTGNTKSYTATYYLDIGKMLRQLLHERLAIKDVDALEPLKFEEIYFSFTDKLRTIHDLIVEYVERTAYDKKIRDKEISFFSRKDKDKNKIQDDLEKGNRFSLINFFNSVASDLIKWDERYLSLIRIKKVADNLESIFWIRYIESKDSEDRDSASIL